MKITELKTKKGNPRLIKDDKFQKLVASIQEFPKMLELRPIIYDPVTMEILGGNMRFNALKELKYKEIPDNWLKSASELTEDEKRRFIITDNVGFGEWDWDILANEWDVKELESWGLDLGGFDINSEEYGDEFSLKDGDKAPFQQMTFTLADEQAIEIQNAIADIKKTDEYKFMETSGNENSNGNALYLIVSQWAEQRK